MKFEGGKVVGLKFLRKSSRTVKGQYRRPILSGKGIELEPTIWAWLAVEGIELSEGVTSDAGV